MQRALSEEEECVVWGESRRTGVVTRIRSSFWELRGTGQFVGAEKLHEHRFQRPLKSAMQR